jgi:NAD(P)H-nitrite reductase large subunit
MMKYCIIGNSAAAVGAVEAIRRVDGENPITIVSDEPYHVYSRPLLPHLLSGYISEEKMYYREKSFYRKNGVEAILGRKVVKIDFKAKRLLLEDGEEIPYDKLLISTGSKPKILDVFKGLRKEGIYTFTTWNDIKKISEALKKASKALVVGGGLIGLKAAESLRKLGLEVTVVVRGPRVLRRIVDEKASEIVRAHLEENGVKVITRNTVKEVAGKERVEAVVLADGRRIDCQLVVLAVGVNPNLDLVRNIEIKVKNGIVVDRRMRTSLPDVYAAGDVVEAYDPIHGVNRLTPIWPNAYWQGYVAGLNMAGEKAEYPGGFDMNSIELFGLPVISVGLVNPSEGVEYETLIRLDGRKRYKKIVLRDGRVVGAVFVDLIARAGIITGLIKDRVDVAVFKDELLKDDFGYVCFPEELRGRLLER